MFVHSFTQKVTHILLWNYPFSDSDGSDPFGLDSYVPNSDENESDSGNSFSFKLSYSEPGLGDKQTCTTNANFVSLNIFLIVGIVVSHVASVLCVRVTYCYELVYR